MGIPRATIKRGPGVAIFNAATIFAKGDIEANWALETDAPESSLHGKLDERLAERTIEVGLTPNGEWKAPLLSVLWPYRSTAIGASLFTDADVPLVIHGRDTERHTYKAAAITQMPDIIMGANKTTIGQMGFSCVIATGADPTTADSYVAFDTAAFASDAQFDLSKVITEAPTVSWATGGGGTTFKTLDGVTVNFDLAYDWIAPDETGRIDATLGDVGVMARFTPIGIDSDDLMDLTKFQGAGAFVRGGRMNSAGFNLTIANSLGSIVINKAILKTGGFRFGRTTLRQGEIGFVSLRSFTAGVRDPLWTLA